jgi:hypothetical protein
MLTGKEDPQVLFRLITYAHLISKISVTQMAWIFYAGPGCLIVFKMAAILVPSLSRALQIRFT